MEKQMVKFVVAKRNGVITTTNNTTILQPKTDFQGGHIKWYEDKLKKSNNFEQK